MAADDHLWASEIQPWHGSPGDTALSDEVRAMLRQRQADGWKLHAIGEHGRDAVEYIFRRPKVTGDEIVDSLNVQIDELLRLADDLDRIETELPLGRPSDLVRINATQRRTAVLIRKTLTLIDGLEPQLRDDLQRLRAAS